MKPQQGPCITSNNRNNQAVVRTRHSDSKFNFFILCPITMTATSHHALQLAHAAGMLSGLVCNEQTAKESRTWGRGEELLGEAAHILACC